MTNNLVASDCIASEASKVKQMVCNFVAANPHECDNYSHLDTFAGSAVYARDAFNVSKYLPSGAHVLDWGCGRGQMSYLLANRGCRVSACDWMNSPDLNGLIDPRVNYFSLTSQTKIDFPDASFDAVISSGTLEHSQNIFASMQEIRRVLKPGGWFFVFRFPAEKSFSEYVARRSGRWAHSILMSKAELQFMLKMFSFRIEKVGYDSFLPIFFGKQMKWMRPVRSRFDMPITLVDKALTSLPLISQFSTSIYCFAQLNTEYQESFERQ